jgi:hypothetical protein
LVTLAATRGTSYIPSAKAVKQLVAGQEWCFAPAPACAIKQLQERGARKKFPGERGASLSHKETPAYERRTGGGKV